MYRFLISTCLFVLSFCNQNLTGDVNPNEICSNSSVPDGYDFYRCPRAAPGKPNKPVDCRRLHATEDTPFIAIILNQGSGRLICMGSIIDEKHILTAYRCVQNTDPKSLRILVGYFKAYWGRHSQVLYVEKILKQEHDLVILRLKRYIAFSRTVKAIQLLKLEDGKQADAAPGSKARGKRAPKTDMKPPDGGRKRKTRDNESKIDKNSTEHQTNEEKGSTERNKSVFRNETRTIVQGPKISKPRQKSSAFRKPAEPGQSPPPAKSPKAGEKKDPPPPPPPLPNFQATHPDITELLLVGFPLSNLNAAGDSISQTLVYSMKEEKLDKADDACLNLYQEKPALPIDEDPNAPFRVFCTDGKSKFCWGCLGGPTLYKKEQEYIQVGVVAGTNCDTEENYMHIRVDINMKWITSNSMVRN